jgi:hypothetical protein
MGMARTKAGAAPQSKRYREIRAHSWKASNPEDKVGRLFMEGSGFEFHRGAAAGRVDARMMRTVILVSRLLFTSPVGRQNPTQLRLKHSNPNWIDTVFTQQFLRRHCCSRQRLKAANRHDDGSQRWRQHLYG